MAAHVMKTAPVGTFNGVAVYESTTGCLFAIPAPSGPTGSAWGPAADGTGEWFASRWLTETGPVRVADRAAAIEYITTDSWPGRAS